MTHLNEEKKNLIYEDLFEIFKTPNLKDKTKRKLIFNSSKICVIIIKRPLKLVGATFQYYFQ